MRMPRAMIARLWPPVPAPLRDAYALSQYRRLTRQMPLLHLALLLIVAATLEAANRDAPALVRYGIPALVLCACLARLLVWAKRADSAPSADFARRKILGMTVFSSLIAVIASAWCVIGWHSSPHHEAIFYPLLMVLGEFATVISMTPIRSAAYANLIIGTGPITLTLAVFGDSWEKVAAMAFAATATFLVGMLRHQHSEVVERLALEKQMTDLAETDALTSLANRRALSRRFDAYAAAQPAGAGPALILIDLDRFKPINDRHGHDVGDAVLIEVAARLREAVAADGQVCRLGGDEFAVLLRPAADRSAKALARAILAGLARPVMASGTPLPVGASLGIALWNGPETTLSSLLARADAAMYQVKRQDSNVAALAQPVRKAWVMG